MCTRPFRSLGLDLGLAALALVLGAGAGAMLGCPLPGPIAPPLPDASDAAVPEKFRPMRTFELFFMIGSRHRT